MIVLDTGSSSTVIDSGFALHHKLPVLKGPFTKEVNYIDRQVSYETSEVAVELVGQDNRFHQMLTAQTVEGFSKSCYLLNWKQEIDKYPFMQNVSVPCSPYPPVGVLLLGCDNTVLFEVLETRRGKPDEPIANKTPLGWAFMGNRKSGELKKEQKASEFFHSELGTTFKSSEDFLDDLVIREFSLETFGLQEKESPFAKGFSGGPKDPASWSPLEQKADAKMKVIYNQKESSFQVSIPWRDDHESNLNGNFNSVKLRQDGSHTEQSLAKKGVKIEEVNLILNNYLEKGYIEEVPRSEQGKGWYLPFFEVVNRLKSTPIRLVFDAKAQYKSVSLNNQIEDTPNRLNDLVLTLLRLRRYKYAVTGDISEMFLRIRMDPEDRKYHRFYHNGKHYQWTRILFGNKSSPNISQKVLSTLCDLKKDDFPEARETVKNSCYMDDVADSKPTEEKLLQLAKQLPVMLLKADMKLCKFYTNSKLVAQSLPKELLAKEISFEDKDPFFESNKVLGMNWDANPDFFTYSLKYKTVSEWKEACKVINWTKRSVLKTTASTFDPLGLLSPIIMFPRTIIQELWAKKSDWDQTIDELSSKKWEECLENILKVSSLRFPRWIYDSQEDLMELHIFCDASEKAFAATVYSRVNAKGEGIRTNLVMAKSRVAPIKNETISRLELVACVIGTRLLNAINIAYNTPSNRVYFYTDSRNALCWINMPAHKLKTYVYNRSAEIQRVSNSVQWSHVSTDVNPADVATRFIATEDLAENKLWFEGPPFLKDPSYTFKPFEANPADLTKEGKSEIKTPTDTVLIYFSPGCVNYWSRKVDLLSVGKLYNDLHKMRKLLMRIFSGIGNWRKCKITSKESFTKANDFIYRLSQMESFYDDLCLIGNKKKIPGGNILSKYSPYIDQNGILRSNSRLNEMDFLPESTRRPIILMGKNKVTKLIVLELHWQNEHIVSRRLTLKSVHEKYIVIGLTKLIKYISAHCVECQKLRANPSTQQMAPLHNRLGIPNRVFAETGIDFAGPFETIQGRGKPRALRFVLVLTCLQTRAVHFESTVDQTTSSVINALIRFASIRGRPKIIISDNQTSFKAASKELRDFYQLFLANKTLIENQLNGLNEPIEWIFIPPRSPHFGGAWEIMVKAMKRALTAISKGQPMTDEMFRTFLCRAMDIINERPLLTHYSTETAHILTPNHFIIGRVDTGVVPFVVSLQTTRLGEKWRQLEALTNNLWHRFIDEILPELSPRQKWKQAFNNLTVGTVVLVVEPGLPRGVWKVGAVVEVELSRDKFARRANIRMGGKTYWRPIANLIPLTN